MNLSERENMDSKEGIDAIFQFATEGILLTNERGEIVHANPSSERLFGYEKGELIGQRIEVLVPRRLTESHKVNREKFNESPHSRSMGAGMELFGLKKNGTEFPVEISLSPYTAIEGKFVVAFIVDITLRKLAEDKLKNYSADLEKQVKNRTLILQEAITELEKTKNELNIALEKEKELNELKSRFVSMASHEFRTPLTTIMSSLSLVKAYGEQNDTQKQSKHIQKIKSSISNLTDILNDFLSVSRLEEGKVEYLPERFDLVEFVKEIISETESLCKNGQVINYQYSGEKLIYIDKKVLKHVLFNLISNAAKFSFENSIIQIKSERLEKEIVLSVEDQGIGISKNDQKHLFQRFFRGRNASNIQGTGLGLNIIENYIDMMKGKISFSSVENKGTIFTIQIPQK